MLKLPSYKEIIELMKKGATLEAQEKIMELRESALNLQKENICLKERITILEKELEIKKQILWDGTVYWLKEDENNQDGPFCQKCYDSDKKLVRLQKSFEKTLGDWYCLVCEKFY